jgi:hypothetical protein
LGVAVLAGVVAACSAGPIQTSPTAVPTPTEIAPGWRGPNFSGDAQFVPIILSSDLSVGPSRFVLTLIDPENRLISSPDLEVELAFYDLAADPANPQEETPGRFIWAVEGDRGLYAANVDFSRAGKWGVEVAAQGPTGPTMRERIVFDVKLQSSTPAIGAPAPPSTTPTAESLEAVASISTDDDPDLDFYRISIRRAIDLGQPFVVVFATPKFCTSRVCGPTLDNVKALAGPYKSRVNFIHVEVVENLEQPDQLEYVPSFYEWGMQTEPWVFVVDSDGRVRAKYEGVVGADELEGVLDNVIRSS